VKNVKIRFNTTYPSLSKYEWRLLIDGVENLVNEIRIEVPSYTSSEFIEGIGMKWHISCQSNSIEIMNSLDKKIAYIK
jgi:hypothetical protein